MVAGLDALYLFVEVNIAFVAFAAIVATLRQSFGGKLTPLQYLLFRFFVESGLLCTFGAFVCILIVTLIEPIALAWWYSTVVVAVLGFPYLAFHLTRRAKMGLKLHAVSKFLSVVNGCFFLFLASTLIPGGLAPSAATLLIYFTWIFGSLLIVFVQFITLFVDTEEPDLEVETSGTHESS